MWQKTIGVLGGMGPEATVEYLRRIVENTRADCDQQHVRVLVDSNPHVPDRTAAILGAGPSPIPALAAGARSLALAGASFIVMPCVSAHVFLDELRRESPLPILSIFDAVASAISASRPRVHRVGLLGTTGTVRGGLFQKRLATDGIDVIVPSDEDQERVMAAIYDVKNRSAPRPRVVIRRDLVAVVDAMLQRGADGIVAACTEIPLALGPEDLRAPYFDAVQILARAAITEAGGLPT